MSSRDASGSRGLPRGALHSDNLENSEEKGKLPDTTYKTEPRGYENPKEAHNKQRDWSSDNNFPNKAKPGPGGVTAEFYQKCNVSSSNSSTRQRRKGHFQNRPHHLSDTKPNNDRTIKENDTPRSLGT